ncbi:MAG: DUF805 domain-containing protein [Bradyrhizobium sp.]
MHRSSLSPLELPALLLSPSGAIGRAAFATGATALCLATALFDRVIARLADPNGIVAFLFVIAVAWSAGCLSRKRLHDLGWSGLAIALFLAAYIAIVVGSPFVLVLPPEGSWSRALLMTALFAGPMLGWCAWLTAMPGEAARESRQAASVVVRA